MTILDYPYFLESNQSTRVSSTTNTSALGIPMMLSCMFFIKLFQYAASNSASRELTSSSPGTAVSAYRS